MTIIRARKPGDVLGSGIRVQPPALRCAALAASDDPFAALVERLEEAGALEAYGWDASPVHPLTLRHLFPWRRLATLLGTDHKTVQRWHRDGAQLILAELCQRP